MTLPPAATTVWIVDDDLGFVWWLGELLSEAGCRALPALSCDQALSLMKEVKVGIDLLVVNPQLPEVAGMLRIFRCANANLKVVAIGKASRAVTAAIRPLTYLERPSGFDPVSRPEWRQKVQKLLKEMTAPAEV